MAKIKLGYAPTRRSIFSAPDAIKYRGLTASRLRELGVDFVDIDDINEEGLLYDDKDIAAIVKKFRKEKVEGLFVPHCNFGTEYVVARLAKELQVPVLLWGPRDERPDENGIRLRDSQCGLFATGKVLRRFRVKFTYMTNCRLTDSEFERGVKDFLAVCNVVRVFKKTRILQIAPRAPLISSRQNGDPIVFRKMLNQHLAHRRLTRPPDRNITHTNNGNIERHLLSVIPQAVAYGNDNTVQPR